MFSNNTTLTSFEQNDIMDKKRQLLKQINDAASQITDNSHVFNQNKPQRLRLDASQNKKRSVVSELSEHSNTPMRLTFTHLNSIKPNLNQYDAQSSIKTQNNFFEAPQSNREFQKLTQQAIQGQVNRFKNKSQLLNKKINSENRNRQSSMVEFPSTNVNIQQENSIFQNKNQKYAQLIDQINHFKKLNLFNSIKEDQNSNSKQIEDSKSKLEFLRNQGRQKIKKQKFNSNNSPNQFDSITYKKNSMNSQLGFQDKFKNIKTRNNQTIQNSIQSKDLTGLMYNTIENLNENTNKISQKEQDQMIYNKYIKNKMSPQFREDQQTNIEKFDKLKDKYLQYDLGNMSLPNPLKITSDTPIQNPLRMASFYFFNKDYQQLTNEQQNFIFNFLNQQEYLIDEEQNERQKSQLSESITRIKKRNTQHEVSEELKDLGYLHMSGRAQTYWPQDSKNDFSSSPQIIKNHFNIQQESQFNKQKDFQLFRDQYQFINKFPSIRNQNLNNSQDLIEKGEESIQIYNNKQNRKNGISNKEYNYNEPGQMEMAYRVPDNLVGQELKEACKQNQEINKQLINIQLKRKQKQKMQNKNNENEQDQFLQTHNNFMPKQQLTETSSKKISRSKIQKQEQFPKTTNQDFFGDNEKIFFYLRKNKQELKNFKKKSEYSQYVNAMFNLGVYSQPDYDQL